MCIKVCQRSGRFRRFWDQNVTKVKQIPRRSWHRCVKGQADSQKVLRQMCVKGQADSQKVLGQMCVNGQADSQKGLGQMCVKRSSRFPQGQEYLVDMLVTFPVIDCYVVN